LLFGEAKDEWFRIFLELPNGIPSHDTFWRVFAILRHIALNLIKQDKSNKASIKGKSLKAGWDNDYLLTLLSGLYS